MKRCQVIRLSVLAVALCLTLLVACWLARPRPAGADDDDCEGGCENCWAEPTFVQSDARRLEAIQFIRDAKAKGAKVYETKHIVFYVK